MRKLNLIIPIGIIVLLVAVAGIVIAQEIERNLIVPDRREIPNKFVQDEIIVKFKGDEKSFRVIKVFEGKILEEIEKYKKRADVIYAEPNHIAYTQGAPNDPYYKYQWHLDNSVYGGIQMEEAWDISTGTGVKVAVVDTGIRKGTDLADTCFVAGYDFANNDTDPVDDNGHGTHVAGTIAQSTNNALGAAGVAFNSCLMPVKVLGSTGSGTYANVALGIRYAADNGAKVINLSLGGSASDITLQDAVKYAYEKGVAVIAACGNSNVSSCLYPAAYNDYVIAVGAAQYNETKAPYSSYGSSLDLMAPGGNTLVDQNGDGYGDGVLQQTFTIVSGRITWGYYFFQGTSMATPHVSGTAALLIAKGNATTPAQIRTALQTTAEDKGATGRDDTYGWGLIDANKALQWSSVPLPNQFPIANAGPDQSAYVGDTVNFNGSGSSDPDGTIVSYAWDFGDNVTGTGVTTSHIYTAIGTYTVNLTVTDNNGAVSSDTVIVSVTEAPAEIAVFEDSFEINEWNGLWTEDSQNDWFRSTQRAINGNYSAEVDGRASNAKLTSIPINLQSRTNAAISFSWYIENGLDLGEYLAFDVSTDGGTTWVEKARLKGNVDPENIWHTVSIDLTGINNLRIQFRGTMSDATEDANVDMVKVIAR